LIDYKIIRLFSFDIFCKINLIVLITFTLLRIFVIFGIVVRFLKGRKAMQKIKHEEVAVFMYLGILLFIVIINLINKVSLIDLVYLVVIVSSVFKIFIILKNDKIS